MTPPHTDRRSYRSHTRATHCEVCKNRIDYGSMCEDCRTRLIAPMIYLIISKHAAGICMPCDMALNPKKYIDSQVSVLLHGMCVQPPIKSVTKPVTTGKS